MYSSAVVLNLSKNQRCAFSTIASLLQNSPTVFLVSPVGSRVKWVQQWNLPPRSPHWFVLLNAALKCVTCRVWKSLIIKGVGRKMLLAPLRALRPAVRFKRWLSDDLFTQAFCFMNSNRPCLQSTEVLCALSFAFVWRVLDRVHLWLSDYWKKKIYIFSCMYLFKPLQSIL